MDDLTLSYEPATGQVFIDGRSAGPAGEAGLTPAEDVDLAFDRADGHLVRVIADAGSKPAEALLTRLFGPPATIILRGARRADTARPFPLSPEPDLYAALSSLALLDATRAASPVATSPWWAAEAAVLAEAAGLPDRALADAVRAVRALSQVRPLALPGKAARTALAAAEIAVRAEAEAARQLRENILVDDQPLPPGAVVFDVAAEVEVLEGSCVLVPGPYWLLDPGLAPASLFRRGLSPRSDLFVRLDAGQGLIVVEAVPAEGGQRAVAGRWYARLVDPVERRVLSRAAFREAGSGLRAELRLPSPPTANLTGTWVEVVEDWDRPVRSTRAHLIQRALRWADAALRAERAPAGLASRSAAADWPELARLAWEQCGRDWSAAGDVDRATSVPLHQAPSGGPDCLAEILGERGSGPRPADQMPGMTLKSRTGVS